MLPKQISPEQLKNANLSVEELKKMVYELVRAHNELIAHLRQLELQREKRIAANRQALKSTYFGF